MPEIDTVNEFIIGARDILQDNAAEAYRYSDVDIVQGLNLGIAEVVRIRPDLYMRVMRTAAWIPKYTAANKTELVSLDARYRHAVLMFIVGWVQLRDDEATQDQRAAGFVNKFEAYLTSASGAVK